MKERIEKARQAAASVLQPSARDLEYGLKLHGESLVWDAYCLGFGAGVDGDAVKAAMDAGAEKREIMHTVQRMGIVRWAEEPELRREYESLVEASGMTGWYQNTESGQTSLTQLRRLAHFVHFTDRNSGFITRATCPDDVVRALESGCHCLVPNLNHVPLMHRWDSLYEEIELLQVFYDLGIRMMHLTYDRRNAICDGCYDRANAGLSDFGEMVVREMNRVGLIVDVSHASRRTGVEAAQVSEKPVVISHSCCAALHDHPRCEPDETVRAVADSGGYIGITCVPYFLGGSGDIAALLDHIEYVARTVGVEHVAIGTDRHCHSARAVEESAKYPPPSRFYPERPRPRMTRQVGGEEPPEKLLTLSLLNWPMFTVGLVQRGFSDDEVRKIIGGNVLRVARAVLPAQDRE